MSDPASFPKIHPVRLRRVAASLGVVAAASLGAVATASATTGPGYLLKHPGFKVTHAETKPFTGIFKFYPHSNSKNLINASMFAQWGQRPQDWFVGQIQMYDYDKKGQEGDWASTLYNFRWTGKGLRAQLVGFGGFPLEGYITLTNVGKGHIKATVTTTSDHSHYTMEFTKTKLQAPVISGD